MIDRRTLIAGASAALLSARARAQSAGAPVRAAAGAFQGTIEGGVRVFRGIRYGHAERFRAPTPISAAAEIQSAASFGPVAPQAGSRYGAQSEDCLFLNIWTAEADPRARKPVMLYIHGGAYSGGSVTDPLNDGGALAARGDVVVVTVNHRLNAFGYLYLARLDPRFADSGNCGQLDLILALQWVRDNIAAFGGDPRRVMVFGQSGGGAKIATMMGMAAADGLFHRAATMSGQQITASGPLNATARTRAYLGKLGVQETDLGALLAMPREKLIEGLSATDPVLGGGVYFGPVLDMKWLTRHPFWPDADPRSNAIPMILGNTHDETRAFIAPDSAKMRGLGWDNIAERIAPELRIDILPEWVVAEYRAHYPAWTPEQVFYDATTCGRSWRGQVIEAEARARAGAPGWVYQLDFASRTDPRRGAFHTMDIPLVFGTLGAAGSQTGTGADARAASKAMQDSFVAFTRTGDPNHAGLPHWPRYGLDKRATMVFDARSRIENDPRKWQRELFARVPYIQPGT
ncbi:para-nitrobenzyl esterase [Sphingomonas naasensis]|uniref:Carboxylic ester hydrolase n=1 Tax=Sphingomonas naasensis TaxID=1344951 RepID=A0A4S1WXN2_9SPHN|nr:carboxylesterase/lipase family protein [Sphingomonas naasensis]NIJ19214.1 para-nitrobenzyl esterase [Sphingomonas naasensis]TGX46396.1 carboxylesterase/lipase family protein [Sphingomonas naasensis]